MLTFRTYTVLFFIILAILNIASIFGCGSSVCFFCSNILWFYFILISIYLVVPVALAFLPCSNFHHKVYCSANTRDQVVALTFDDGPDPVTTAGILDILKGEQVLANFFVVGKKMEVNESIVRRIVSEGHLIGNHSWSHSYWFDLFTAKRMIREFAFTEDAVKRITGMRPMMIRPPYGVVNPMVSKAARKSKNFLIGWNIRSLDTVKKDPSEISTKILKKLKPGAILLLHDTSSFSSVSLRSLILEIRQRGYTFVLLDQLLNLPAYE